MKRKIPDSKAYEQLKGTLKKNKNGITLADMAASTGLSLYQVRNLAPMAADEYSARLEVTESGEILYSFPQGFRSRYRGLGNVLKRQLSSFVRISGAVLKVCFKAWIMVMLVGYFLLFMVIALAAMIISVTVSSNSNNRRDSRGGLNVSFGLFNMILRLWLYSEMLGGAGRRYGGSFGYGGSRNNTPAKKGRPLHRAIFSFVFGEDNPNRDRELAEKTAFVSYVRSRRGVVSLPELMTLLGQAPSDAEATIMSLCAEFGGSPEVTEEGTLVYRFDEILMSGEKNNYSDQSSVSGMPAPFYKKLKIFSSNTGKMNFWFGLINGVNLLFGSYFLVNAVKIGSIIGSAPVSMEAAFGAGGALQGTGLFGLVFSTLYQVGLNPFPVIGIGLGFVPLIFSVFFWLIPAVRSLLLKKENDAIRLGNFRSLGFGSIWSNPSAFSPQNINPGDNCHPHNLKAAEDILVREMTTYSIPEVTADEKQREVFSFQELSREKAALERYRQSVDPLRSSTGKTVFDTGAANSTP